MNSIFHKASTRGGANYGWLNTKHTFSFADYYDAERMNFGALRVLNDDTIDGGTGFEMHPHDNMEIITIPLEGDLEHIDSMNNSGIISHGDIQVMSAGSGIYHSEFNASENYPLSLLQIWVFPNKQNVIPRYDQISLNLSDRHNKLQQILSPYEKDAGVWIHQDAWFHLGKFDKGISVKYKFKCKANGLYIFIINGDVRIGNQKLGTRDGYGVCDVEYLTIEAISEVEFLLMEVPIIL